MRRNSFILFLLVKNTLFWGSIGLTIWIILSITSLRAEPLISLTDPVNIEKTIPAVTGGENRFQKIRPLPKAYAAFCRIYPLECLYGGPEIVQYSERLILKLYEINDIVNRTIKWRRDKLNNWQLEPHLGDCEDYALTKRSRLIKHGIPASSLRMAIVKKARDSGEIGHAVLVVRTTRGDLVLDNMTSKIKKRENTDYRWIGMATANPHRWTLL